MFNKKKLYLSKTFYFGVITALLPIMSDSAQAFVSEHTATVGILWGALTVVLRMVTKDKVTLTE